MKICGKVVIHSSLVCSLTVRMHWCESQVVDNGDNNNNADEKCKSVFPKPKIKTVFNDTWIEQVLLLVNIQQGVE